MLPVDVAFKVVTAVVGLGFGATLLALRPRPRPALLLGVFLLLISVNQAAEAMRSFSETPTPWFRLATVAAALDPLALLLFMLSLAEGSGRWRWFVAGGGAGASATLAVLSLVAAEPALSSGVTLALLAYTALAYVFALALTLGMLGRAEEPGRGVWTLVFAATALAAVPIVARLADLLVMGAFGLHPLRHAMEYLVGTGAALVLCGAVALAARAVAGLEGAPLRRVGLALGASMLLTMLLRTYLFVATFFRSDPDLAWIETSFEAFGRLAAPVRWLGFGILVSAAVVRHDAFHVSAPQRRMAARVLIGLVAFVSVSSLILVVEMALGQTPTVVKVVEVAALATALVLSQGFRRLADAAAHKAYDIPLQGAPEARAAAYRADCVKAAREGRDLASDPLLRRRKQELELDEETARLVERMAEEQVVVHLAPGQRVAGRYEIVSMLGRGGHGRAFLARDRLLDRTVAVKEVPCEPGEEDAVLREARLGGGLSHPNVVTVHDVLQRGATLLLVTEYVEGGSLADLVRRRGPLRGADAARALEGVAAGMEALHGRGVVHRDLKPENVLVTAAGEAKLCDFGIASRVQEATVALMPGAPVLGTLAYMAPEVRMGGRATPAADVYAFGLLARACVQAPLPPGLARVVERATMEEPSARWRDGAELRAALAEPLRALAEQQAPEPPPRASSRPVDEERASDADDVAV